MPATPSGFLLLMPALLLLLVALMRRRGVEAAQSLFATAAHTLRPYVQPASPSY